MKMDRSYHSQMNTGQLTLERRHETLQPVTDPQYRGLFVVTTYQDYCRLLRQRESQSDTATSNGKTPIK